jgi:hypothetical protein
VTARPRVERRWRQGSTSAYLPISRLIVLSRDRAASGARRRHSGCVEGTAQVLLRGLVRGDEDPFDVVRRLGGVVSSSAGSLVLQLGPNLSTVELPLSDLAHGLLVHWS